MDVMDRVIGSGISQPSLLPGGCLNYVYLGFYDDQKVVLKVFNTEFNECRRRFHNELESIIAFSHLKIPTLIKSSLEDLWIMTHYLKGESLNTWQLLSRKVDVCSVVDSVKQIHSTATNFEIDSNRKYLDWLINKLKSQFDSSGFENPIQSSIKKGIAYLEKEKFELEPIKLGLVNGDLNSNNILLDDLGKVNAIVDWEFSHIGNRYLDLVKLTSKDNEFYRLIRTNYFRDEFDGQMHDFFNAYSLIRTVLNNSPNNIKRMASLEEGKLKMVADKSRTLVEMF